MLPISNVVCRKKGDHREIIKTKNMKGEKERKPKNMVQYK